MIYHVFRLTGICCKSVFFKFVIPNGVRNLHEPGGNKPLQHILGGESLKNQVPAGCRANQILQGGKMKRTFTGLFMLMAGSLLVSQMASANSIAGKVYLSGNLGYSMYTMEQFNEQVDIQNETAPAFMTRLASAQGSLDFTSVMSESINKINGGLTFGGGVMYGLMSNLLVGLEIDYLTAASKGKVEGSGTIMGLLPITATTTIEASAGALLIGPVIKYAMPICSAMLLTGGIGLDYASVAGSYKMDVTSESMGITTILLEDEKKLTGSGIGFKFLVGGEMFVNPMISVGADLGYRILKITELKDEDDENVTIMDETGNLIDENMELDYSGLIIKGGVKLYF